MCKATSMNRVCYSIESLVGIPAKSQVWLVNNEEVPLQQATTLGDTNICDGDRITVVHAGFEPLVPLPEFFKLSLTSVRERLHRGYSSAFTIVYKIEANIPEGRMSIEPWRKNDHDKTVYDCKACIKKCMTSHWMSGQRTHDSKLDDDPLSSFVASWSAPCIRVKEASERFWRNTDALETHPNPEFDDDEKQDYPNHNAVPGWFVALSEDCIELMVDVPILGRNSICRLLIDAEGRPVRAALKGCKASSSHQDIEEYDVVLKTESEVIIEV